MDPSTARAAPASVTRMHTRRQIISSMLLGIVVAVVGIGVLPAAQGTVGPAEMALGITAGTHGTTLGLPPLGNVAARTHLVPLDIELSLVEVDVEPLARSVTSQRGRDLLGREVAADVRGLAIKAVLQLMVLLALLAAGAAALILGRNLVSLVVTPATAVAVVGIALAVILVTFDVSAFQEPKFTGSLTKARAVVDAVSEGAEVLDEARSRFDVASERLSGLIALLGVPDEDPRVAETIILHVSDIHANPVGFEVVRQLARQFDVDAVIDTGDLASSFLDTGGISSVIDPIDRMIAREVASVPVPYLYVAGNHDSPELRREVSAAPNVASLGTSPEPIGALTILGWPDPTFARSPVPESEKSDERLQRAPDVATAVATERPDILAVHDAILAAESMGSVPVVLAGHIHERSETLNDGTLVLTVGSTGATGLKSLTVETDLSYEAQILYIEDDLLIAVDYVTLHDLGGDFELTRRTYGHPLAST